MLTQYRVSYPSLGLGLVVRSRRMSDALLARNSIRTGDDGFDDLVVVEGDREPIVEYLTEERRATLGGLVAGWDRGRVEVSDRRILCEHPGGTADPSLIVSIVRRLIEVACILATEEELGDA